MLAAFTTGGQACRSNVNQPPGADALAALAKLKGVDQLPDNVRSLADYQQHAEVANMTAVSER